MKTAVILLIHMIYLNICVSTIVFAEWSQNGPQEYFISYDQGNYSDATSQCTLMNASLAILSDPKQFGFVNELLMQLNISNGGLYVFALRKQSGQFEWGNNASSFPGGVSWEPDNSTNQNFNEQKNCVAMKQNTNPSSNVFSLQPVSCSAEMYGYICERDAGRFWLLWSDWSSCSSSCIPGSRTRSRGCATNNEIGTNYCIPQSDGIQTERCNTNLCTETKQTTTDCNATCDEIGIFQTSVKCYINHTTKHLCNDVTNHLCNKNCSTPTTTTLSSTTAINITTPTNTKPFVTEKSVAVGVVGGISAGGTLLVAFLVSSYYINKKRRLLFKYFNVVKERENEENKEMPRSEISAPHMYVSIKRNPSHLYEIPKPIEQNKQKATYENINTNFCELEDGAYITITSHYENVA